MLLFEKESSAMTTTYTFEIDEKLKDRLEKMAEEGHRTLASQIRMILEEYTEKK